VDGRSPHRDPVFLRLGVPTRPCVSTVVTVPAPFVGCGLTQRRSTGGPHSPTRPPP
jgi:hypothetical protein